MEDSEKVIVNFVNENNGKRHELEIPLNITAKALVTALNKAYNLQIDEANENECYMACEQPIAFLKETGCLRILVLGMVRQLYLGENENGKLWMVNRIKSGICSDNRECT